MDQTGKNAWLTSVGSFWHKSSDQCSQGLCVTGLTRVTERRLESVVRSAPPPPPVRRWMERNLLEGLPRRKVDTRLLVGGGTDAAE